MPVIVISYRRKDSGDLSRRIHRELAKRYGTKSVYIDVDSILPSADYRVHIRHTLERALVMLAVIGKDWSGPRVEGGARIFDHDDPVRIEVQTALENRRPLMPVLVEGASMPGAGEIPASLGRLPYLHAVEIQLGDRFHADMARLIRAIDRLVARLWAIYVLIYLVLPVSLVLLSYYIILHKVDPDPLYLRLAVAVVGGAAGIGLRLQTGLRAGAAILTGVVVGAASSLGMMAVNTALSTAPGPFIPSNTREWQEVVEYSGIVATMMLLGNLAAQMFRNWRTQLHI